MTRRCLLIEPREVDYAIQSCSDRNITCTPTRNRLSNDLERLSAFADASSVSAALLEDQVAIQLN